MKFLVDESADARLATHLRRLGHDAKTVASDYQPGLEDQEVLAIALREERILITNDRDFGELVYRLGLPHAGVILLRLSTTSLPAKTARLDAILAKHAGSLTRFVVVTERSVRLR
jgi:predicted nuclease of predicted toxin-antitoxin system